MGQITLQIPQAGQPFSTEGPKVASDMTAIQTVINGNLDATNLSSSAGILFTQLASTGWQAVTLGTSVVNGATLTPGARLMGDTVTLKGSINANAAGLTLLLTLPVGSRPSAPVGARLFNASAPAVVGARVLTDGTLNLAAATTLSSNIIYLDGVTFTLT